MNYQQKKKQYSDVRDQEIRAALDQHWAASDTNDFETEHRIYREDAVLEYPQSGERTRGRSNIQNQRASQPSKKRFAVRRIIGSGDLWVTEFILTYDGKPYGHIISSSQNEKTSNQSMKPMAPSRNKSKCLPPTPPVAYLFFVRPVDFHMRSNRPLLSSVFLAVRSLL